MDYAIRNVRELAGAGLPTFGICLGHQLVGLAFGGSTAKLPYGHRGGNHPVRDLRTGHVLITTQNHGFAVVGDAEGVPGAAGLAYAGLFNGADVNHFLLEFDTPRAGDFAPLAMVPKSQGVVLGLVSSKNPALEPLDLLKKRVEEASKHIDAAQLAISPQCGFASSIVGNDLSIEDERRKLERECETARRIWK